MSMLIEPLKITTPIAAFNGGLLVNRDMSVVEKPCYPKRSAGADLIGSLGLDAWVIAVRTGTCGTERAPRGPGKGTVEVPAQGHGQPRRATRYAVKLVGVSDDLDPVARANRGVQQAFGNHVTAARSQPYYLDVTHPNANKGAVAGTFPEVRGSRRKRSPRSATCPTTC